MSVSYLDNAATTPVRREVLEAMTPYLTSHFGNPSSHHTVGEQAAHALADARARVAAVLGMRATDVIFTSGATEANNLALKGVAIAAQQRRGARHVVTTPIEHESVLGSVDYLTRIHGFDATLVPVDTTGLVDPDSVAAAIRDDTAIVSVGYANNEIGTVQDVAGLVAAVAGRPLHIRAPERAAEAVPPGGEPQEVDTAPAEAGRRLGDDVRAVVMMFVRRRVRWVSLAEVVAARAPRARHAGRKFTKIYGNPRACIARALCINFATAKNTVQLYSVSVKYALNLSGG